MCLCFLLRIKTKKFTTAKKLFTHLNPKSKSEYQMKIWIFGAKAYLASLDQSARKQA